MVDLSFSSRAKNFVPLSLLRFLADISPANLPEPIAYIGETGLQAIKGTFSLKSHNLAILNSGTDYRYGPRAPRPTERTTSQQGRMGYYRAFCRKWWLGRVEFQDKE